MLVEPQERALASIYGQYLSQLVKTDLNFIQQWGENIENKIQTDGKHHKNITTPATFPDGVALGYYMHPAVSSLQKISVALSDNNYPELRDLPSRIVERRINNK